MVLLYFMLINKCLIWGMSYLKSNSGKSTHLKMMATKTLKTAQEEEALGRLGMGKGNRGGWKATIITMRGITRTVDWP